MYVDCLLHRFAQYNTTLWGKKKKKNCTHTVISVSLGAALVVQKWQPAVTSSLHFLDFECTGPLKTEVELQQLLHHIKILL